MFRIMLVYGAIAGALMIVIIAIGVQFNGGDFSEGSQAQGYLIMILASSLIFVGVKRYRDKALGGVIKFWPALKIGFEGLSFRLLCLALLAGAISEFRL